ncbi:uncharacterized protein BDV17DRAFT_296356 [Aspergillus undulatus]|uniref:uncharacterized protein n=1 Tax=Aspergillus undulatus TaxID=1810928 RepID=UPI003CCDA25F
MSSTTSESKFPEPTVIPETVETKYGFIIPIDLDGVELPNRKQAASMHLAGHQRNCLCIYADRKEDAIAEILYSLDGFLDKVDWERGSSRLQLQLKVGTNGDAPPKEPNPQLEPEKDEAQSMSTSIFAGTPLASSSTIDSKGWMKLPPKTIAENLALGKIQYYCEYLKLKYATSVAQFDGLVFLMVLNEQRQVADQHAAMSG